MSRRARLLAEPEQGSVAALTHDGEGIVRGGKTRTLEGGWTPSRVVVLEFPDYATAERFYDSTDYKPVLDMRLKAGKSKAIIVDGHNG